MVCVCVCECGGGGGGSKCHCLLATGQYNIKIKNICIVRGRGRRGSCFIAFWPQADTTQSNIHM